MTGFMGVGKTGVGACLAQLLGTRFQDLDRVIEAEAGVSISRIFEDSGEEEFRRLESAALRRLAHGQDDCVIATGGGTVTVAENVETMRSTGVTIWLDASFEEILARLDRTARAERPLFASEDQARALYQARRADYASASMQVVVAPSENPEQVAERIRRELPASAWTREAGVPSR